MPNWLPKTQIWICLDRWGIEGAASVIEGRVQQAGGTPHEETAVERAQRIEREIAAEDDRKYFLNSSQGVQTANNEKVMLFHELERLAHKISASGGEGLSRKSGTRESSYYLPMNSASGWFGYCIIQTH